MSPSVKSISSRENPDFRDLLALATDPRTRRKVRQTLLDGPHLIEAALEAGVVPRRLVFSESAHAGVLAAWDQRLTQIPTLVLSDGLFTRLSPVETPAGLLAQVDVPHAQGVQAGVADQTCMVLLEDIQDPGNLGAILRVAAAAGVPAVYLSKGSCEAWSPKCLRGGQGAQFQLQIREGMDLPELVAEFPGPVYAATLGAEASLFGLDLTGPVGFAFGNEGAGLSPALRQAARPFAIPMPGRVESLNVATAAAVCLFERVRQLANSGAVRVE